MEKEKFTIKEINLAIKEKKDFLVTKMAEL